ncbi:MAG: sulfurtransferase TusA family protein [Gammaproteobacteria bacterium]|nr:sulfurtransferase TusA family protein [Gammaproteobacteria bacterium]
MIQNTLDCSGLHSPTPLLWLSRAVRNIKNGERVEIIATDPGTATDIQIWGKHTGNMVVNSKRQNDKFIFIIEKTH